MLRNTRNVENFRKEFDYEVENIHACNLATPFLNKSSRENPVYSREEVHCSTDVMSDKAVLTAAFSGRGPRMKKLLTYVVLISTHLNRFYRLPTNVCRSLAQCPWIHHLLNIHSRKKITIMSMFTFKFNLRISIHPFS